MTSSQQCFKTHYNILLRGVNRIRFIKKKQVHNHREITNQLNKIISTIQPQPQPQPQPQLHNMDNPRNFTSRGKFKIAPIKNRYDALQPTQDQSSITKQSHYVEPNSKSQNSLFLNQKSIRNCSTQKLRLREMQDSKWQNYKEMKQLQRQFSKRKQMEQEQSLRAVRQKVIKITKQKQEGRKKIENNYFQYINSIHLNKQVDKERRTRMTEKKYEEMEMLQRQENQEIQMYQSTLALQHQLKRIIEQQLRQKQEKSTFITIEMNDSL